MRDRPSSSSPPPIALQKWRERLVAGMVSKEREVWMCALSVGSVAATKSAKDKGVSRVFIGVPMWTKVGRKELCQWWRSFWVSDERRDF